MAIQPNSNPSPRPTAGRWFVPTVVLGDEDVDILNTATRNLFHPNLEPTREDLNVIRNLYKPGMEVAQLEQMFDYYEAKNCAELMKRRVQGSWSGYVYPARGTAHGWKGVTEAGYMVENINRENISKENINRENTSSTAPPLPSSDPSPAAVPSRRSSSVSSPVRVYTASKLTHGPLWRDLAQRWTDVIFVSRWAFLHVTADGAPGWPDDCPAHAAEFWKHDLEDVAACDVVLVYGGSENKNEHDGSGSDPYQSHDVLRGALVEAGIGLALGKTIIVVGLCPSYSTWQFHPQVRRVDTLEDAYSVMRLMGTTGKPREKTKGA